MHPNLSLVQCLFIVSIFLQCMIVVPDTPTMEACQPTTCGNLTITYPFWMKGVHPSYCGNPSLEIDCRGGNPVLMNSYENSYFMKDVFYHNNSFVAVSKYFQNVPGGCYIPEFNVSIGIGPFEISSMNKMLIFFYDCAKVKRPRSADFLHITCNSTLPQNANESYVRLYANDTSKPQDLLSNCSITKRPVLGWSTQPASQYMSLMKDGFLVELKVASCADCRASISNGTCGFNASTSSFMCICSDNTTHPVSCPAYIPPETWMQSHKGMAVIGSSVVGAIAVSLACLIFLFKFRRTYILSKQYTQLKKIQQRLGLFGPLAPRRYQYRELKKITWSFREKLGQGGFGTVYKGATSNGQLVAVKILHDSQSNMEQFLNEVASIGRTSHVNVVTLLGFCFEGSKQALVYEYMHNGSLDKHLSITDDSKATLEWEKIYEITIGIARGLEYLHQGCNTHIVHFDIKPQNILLDKYFTPKIADFGLAKLCPLKESIISTCDMRGTIGFIAPEVFSRSFGAVSTKADVYSFGMVLLEIVEKRSNLKPSTDNSSQDYFPHWVYHRLLEGQGIQISDVSDFKEEIARKIALVGLWCTQIQPNNRPSMDRVVEMLERSLDELEMPPKPSLDSLCGSTTSSINCTCSTNSAANSKLSSTEKKIAWTN